MHDTMNMQGLYMEYTMYIPGIYIVYHNQSSIYMVYTYINGIFMLFPGLIHLVSINVVVVKLYVVKHL